MSQPTPRRGIRIVCTGRGHPRLVIAEDYWPDQLPPAGGAVHVFQCLYHAGRRDACGRNEQIAVEFWPDIATGLIAQGLTELDITMIPHLRG